MASFNMREEPVVPVPNSENFDSLWRAMKNDFHLVHTPVQHGSRQIGVALFGLGRMGTIHLYNLVREPRVKLLYIIDNDPKRLAFVEKRYFLESQNVKLISPEQIDLVMNDKAVEACIIATPTFTHEIYAKAALLAKKHVLCEKPLAIKLDDVRELYKLAADNKLHLICAFNRRYDPSFRQIQHQVRNGEVGPVRVIKSCSRDSPTPGIDYIKISGGIFHDCVVHDVDLIVWMIQELPIEVHAFGHCYMEDYKALDDFDTCVISLKFKSGALGLIDISRKSSYGYDQRIEVFGEKGMLKLDEDKATAGEQHDATGIKTSCLKFSFPSRYAEGYQQEIVDLLNHIEGRCKIIV